MPKELTDDQREDVERAAEELDALWDLQATLGGRDGRGGVEYEHRSAAPLLRQIARGEVG